MPDDVFEQLLFDDRRGKHGHGLDVFTEQLLELLALAQTPVDLNTIIVAGWRQYQEVWQRKKVNTRLSHLCKTGRATRVSSGVYRIKKALEK